MYRENGFTISGDAIERVEQLNDYQVVIVLKNGKRILVEADFYDEIRTCRSDDDICYKENVRLIIAED
jgi:uncharacterized protein YlzI (FlbEa/FlbD family)